MAPPFEYKKGFKRHCNEVLRTARRLLIIFEFRNKSQMERFQGHGVGLPKTSKSELNLEERTCSRREIAGGDLMAWVFLPVFVALFTIEAWMAVLALCF